LSPSPIARGGKAIYGAAVGILMLEARFPRIPGDVGNATTWPFSVLYKVVRGASPERVVRRRAAGLLDAFVAAGRELVAEGADDLVTNCGFLSLFQDDLAAACAVPVAASALMQAPLIERLLPPGRRVGVLTVSAASLTRSISQPPASRWTRRSSAPRAARSSRGCSLARSSSSTSPPANATSWTPAIGSSPAIPRSARSCSNAPTCAPTHARYGTGSACRSSTW
jgi:hypothetical protein